MYLYLYSLIQRSVHERVEREEEGADGVEESISVLAVPIEPAVKTPPLKHKKSPSE